MGSAGTYLWQDIIATSPHGAADDPQTAQVQYQSERKREETTFLLSTYTHVTDSTSGFGSSRVCKCDVCYGQRSLSPSCAQGIG